MIAMPLARTPPVRTEANVARKSPRRPTRSPEEAAALHSPKRRGGRIESKAGARPPPAARRPSASAEAAERAVGAAVLRLGHREGELARVGGPGRARGE